MDTCDVFTGQYCRLIVFIKKSTLVPKCAPTLGARGKIFHLYNLYTVKP